MRSRRPAFLVRRGAFLAIALAASLPGGMSSSASEEIPGAPQRRPIALVGGTIHPVDAETIEEGVLLFEGGKIVALGKRIDVPDDVQTIDISGKHVYPGLIQAYGHVGLVEIDSVRATVDTTETGEFNPNVEAVVAVNPDSELIPVTRSNGILTALTAPGGGRIFGRAGVISLDGWTWEEMTVVRSAAMVVDWPRWSLPRGLRGEEASKFRERRDEEIGEFDELFAAAARYREARANDPANQSANRVLEALLPVVDGTLPMIVHADERAEIESAVAFAAKRKLKVVIHGGYDAPDCAETLKRHAVPVIVSATLRLRTSDDDPYDAPYALPERLRAAGVKYCIGGDGRFDASNARNVPYHAAMAVAYGLPHDEGLRSVTLYPAEILGVADRLGSLTPGKDATILVTNGDPLEVATNVEKAWIAGRTVDLNDRQKRLYDKYRRKYD